ncbi:hypothetical protein [Corynebacterium comes]|uniref:Secreted protein n=1 Tax=Corynebacterium comes TaxID=2675218 RepID=A0A6B8VN26_9CORY|nr:hypothetical protein [Corynebacterium comes]QGU04529.1 hypothetical protein CETAM_06330 [Corynebacterium comes]
MRRVITIATFIALLGTAPAAAALPALPPGVNVQEVVGAPISVPAGQTTTVDLGVPVSVSYNSGGWSVTSAGTAVSVTAPAEGGTSIVVPVSAAGYSANLTLVAEEGASVPASPASPGPTGGGEAPGSGPDESSAGLSEGTAGRVPGETSPDDGSAASAADRSGAELIELESTVEGNRIVASLGMMQALKLLNQFKDVSRDGLTLRYLDAEGRLIKGVARDIDEGSRTLTLTYPEGETPDNPFIMELVRDGAAVAVVTLTDPNVPIDGGADDGDPASTARAEAAGVAGGDVTGVAQLAGAGVLGLLVIVGVVFFLARRRRGRD